METIIANLHFILLGMGLFFLIAFAILRKYYHLDDWVKIVFPVMIAVSFLSAAGMAGYKSLTGKTSKDDYSINFKKDKPPKSKSMESMLIVEKAEKVRTKIIQEAQDFESEIEEVITSEVKLKKRKIKSAIDSLKQKRKNTFKQDSLLLRLEALELMVAARKDFLKKDLSAFEEKSINSELLEMRINNYKQDIDSLMHTLSFNNL